MQRPPQDGYTGRLQAQELSGDGVDVSDEEGVIGRGWDKCCGEVECCAICVESGPPWNRVIIYQIASSELAMQQGMRR